MHRETKLKVKITYSIIGLMAIVLPIFLIAINFQPLGFLVKPHSISPSPSPVNHTVSPTGTPLVTKEEFDNLKAKADYAVVDIRPGNLKAKGSLGFSPDELKLLIKSTSAADLQKQLKTQNVILESNDLVTSKDIATLLEEKSFSVTIYFTKEL